MESKYFISLLLLVITLNCCKDDNAKGDKIEVCVCDQRNPDWLLSEIKDVTNKTSLYRPVSVYSFVQDGTEYIVITDIVNSSAVDALMFFLCSGERIESSTDTYEKLKQAFAAKAFHLLWSN